MKLIHAIFRRVLPYRLWKRWLVWRTGRTSPTPEPRPQRGPGPKAVGGTYHGCPDPQPRSCPLCRTTRDHYHVRNGCGQLVQAIEADPDPFCSLS